MTAQILFQGRHYLVNASVRLAILELAYQAQARVLGGIKPGNLRWSHPARDFFWHDEAGQPVFMDAYQLIALARRVMEHSEEVRLQETATSAHDTPPGACGLSDPHFHSHSHKEPSYAD